MRPNNNNHSSLNISNQDRTRTPKRNLFITFWLWLCIILNVFIIVYLIYFSVTEWRYFYDTPGVILSAVLSIVGYIMLLKWRKRGFYLVCLAWLLQYFLSISDYDLVYNMVLSVCWAFTDRISTMSDLGYIGVLLINFGILLGILQIKKNGVSCWSQLRW